MIREAYLETILADNRGHDAVVVVAVAAGNGDELLPSLLACFFVSFAC